MSARDAIRLIRPLLPISRLPPTRSCPGFSRARFSQSVAQLDSKPTAVTSNYKQPPVPKNRKGRQQLPVYPIIAIFFLGTFLFYRLTKAREGVVKAKQASQPGDKSTIKQTKGSG